MLGTSKCLPTKARMLAAVRIVRMIDSDDKRAVRTATSLQGVSMVATWNSTIAKRGTRLGLTLLIR